MKSETTLVETPMLKQYNDIKARHQDAILFYRLGDFYEMFLEDAKIASRELELTLTGRGKDEQRIPMCGFPYHSAEPYIAKLVSRGYKVAICEQVEEASASKGLTKRDVVKVITPGIVLSEGMLDEKSSNYLLSVSSLENGYSGAFVEFTTGEFKCFTVSTLNELMIVIYRLGARELLIPIEDELNVNSDFVLTRRPFPSLALAKTKLQRHFNVGSLAAFGIDNNNPSLSAAWAVLDYVIETQKHAAPQITKLVLDKPDHHMSIDHVTLKNLEIVENLNLKDKQGSLFWCLDQTKTAMGARFLKRCLIQPLMILDDIQHRLDAVEQLVSAPLIRDEIKTKLSKVYDLERLMSRIVSEINNPRDLLGLKQSIDNLSLLGQDLGSFKGKLLTQLNEVFTALSHESHPLRKLASTIETAIEADVPPHIRDGNIIKDGFNDDLDQLKSSFKTIKEWISGLEQTERETTGISSLKVRFNKVFGYYIEIPNSKADQIPDNYIRKQTLTNAERYITPELKEKEITLLNGEEKQKALEQEIYKDLIQHIKTQLRDLQVLASKVAALDVYQSLATVAQKNNYCRPQLLPDGNTLSLKNARHPVLEKNTDLSFIPNDINMNNDENFYLITGPNMAGKSTLMRQVGLCIIMAQIGSFVPADEAVLSLTDKLFTRIGALDNLYLGQSTYMVEMVETAAILHNASQNSVIILDEIGRGTATFDGMSIAWAVSEYIHEIIGARTFFATHYHELTAMENDLKRLKNYSMKITEADNKLAFTFKLIPGPADKSYGIHVAQMAGLPNEVIQKAETLLQSFESEGLTRFKDTPPVAQMTLF